MRRASDQYSPRNEQVSKRKKRIDSCQNCRLRKVKCDQNRPCKHCIRRGESSSCTYEGQVKKCVQSDQSSERSPSLGYPLFAELARVKARLERIEAKGSTSSIPRSPVTSTTSQNNSEWKDWSISRRLEQKRSLYSADNESTSKGGDSNAGLSTIGHLLSLLPTRDEAKQLIEDNNRRLLKTIFGNVVHMPTLRQEVTAFYDGIAVNKDLCHVSTDWLALLFAFMLLAITHPSRFPGQYPSQMTPDTTLEMHPNTSNLWYTAALVSLAEDHMRVRSIQALQAIVMLDFYEADVGLKLARLRLAITSAQMMGLHRLGPDDNPCRDDFNDTNLSAPCEREIQKRIWWSLVVKDWNGALEVHGYIIQPHLCSTSFPCNYNDEDLSQHQAILPRSLEEHTSMSSLIWTIKLSSAIRQHGDLLQRQACKGEALSEDDIAALGTNYVTVWETAPAFYRSAIQVGYIDLKRNAIMVQSWMLQQGVFHKLLDLHCSNFSSRPGSFEICFDLAQSILNIQCRIRTTCSLVDQLWVNLAHSFSSAIVLLIGLLHKHKKVERIDRQATRKLIQEALGTFDFINEFHANAAIRMQRVVEVLLHEEQNQFEHTSQSPLVATFCSKGGLVDENLLRIVAKVVKEVSLDASKADGEDQIAPTKTTRPFHGILQPGAAEPNGVKLGLSNSALPFTITNALESLNKTKSFASEATIPDLREQQDDFVASNANCGDVLNLPVVVNNASLLDMSHESDEFWSWLLSENLLMLDGPSD